MRHEIESTIPYYNSWIYLFRKEAYKVFSLEFAASMPRTKKRYRFMLVRVEHLIELSVLRSTASNRRTSGGIFEDGCDLFVLDFNEGGREQCNLSYV